MHQHSLIMMVVNIQMGIVVRKIRHVVEIVVMIMVGIVMRIVVIVVMRYSKYPCDDDEQESQNNE